MHSPALSLGPRLFFASSLVLSQSLFPDLPLPSVHAVDLLRHLKQRERVEQTTMNPRFCKATTAPRVIMLALHLANVYRPKECAAVHNVDADMP